jgi:hypothetical protein
MKPTTHALAAAALLTPTAAGAGVGAATKRALPLAWRRLSSSTTTSAGSGIGGGIRAGGVLGGRR